MAAMLLPSLIQSPLLLEHPRIVHGFTTRHGGFGRPPFDTLNLGLHVGDHPQTVVDNRRLVCRSLGFALHDWVSGDQVHGVNVAVVGKNDAGRGAVSIDTALPATDGLISLTPGLLLAAYFADCVPVFFVDPDIPAVGVAHAGWRGTLGGIVNRMVEQFQMAFSTPPERLLVWIGPAVGPCCYRVDQEVAEQFSSLPFVSDGAAISRRGNSFWLDLKLINRLRLLDAGVNETNMDMSNHCTCCEPQQFFSHRKQGPATGRMAALIGISPS